MRAALVFTMSVLFLFLAVVVHAAESGKECGTVTGNITVWRTRVRTEGTRNDADVVVYLQKTGETPVPAITQTVHMDQQNLIFVPHVLPVLKGTSVKFLNSDTVDHNVYLLFEESGKTLDLGTWGQGITTDYLFNETGAAIVLCKLHLEMAAYVVVLESPLFYQAHLDENTQAGTFTLNNVPPGSYALHAWHKKLKMKGGPAQITVECDHITQANITITKSKYAN